jgi:hypothetical protein
MPKMIFIVTNTMLPETDWILRARINGVKSTQRLHIIPDIGILLAN